MFCFLSSQSVPATIDHCSWIWFPHYFLPCYCSEDPILNRFKSTQTRISVFHFAQKRTDLSNSPHTNTQTDTQTPVFTHTNRQTHKLIYSLVPRDRQTHNMSPKHAVLQRHTQNCIRKSLRCDMYCIYVYQCWAITCPATAKMPWLCCDMQSTPTWHTLVESTLFPSHFNEKTLNQRGTDVEWTFVPQMGRALVLYLTILYYPPQDWSCQAYTIGSVPDCNLFPI